MNINTLASDAARAWKFLTDNGHIAYDYDKDPEYKLACDALDDLVTYHINPSPPASRNNTWDSFLVRPRVTNRQYQLDLEEKDNARI